MADGLTVEARLSHNVPEGLQYKIEIFLAEYNCYMFSVSTGRHRVDRGWGWGHHNELERLWALGSADSTSTSS